MSGNQNTPPPKPGEAPPPKTDDQEKTPLRSDAKFWVAIALILGMLIILVIAAAQEQYTQTTQLAAIFSGWITSIVAFYFYTQSNTQLQSQAKTSAQNEGAATQRAQTADKRAQTAEKKVNKIVRAIPVEEAGKARAVQAPQETIERIKAILQETDES